MPRNDVSESPFAYRFRFHVRRDHGPMETVEVVAKDGSEARDKMIEKVGGCVTSWDFATWGDGSYRRAVA